MKKLLFSCWLFLFSALTTSMGQTIFRVSPNAWDNGDGNSFYIVPFSASASSRYQQIYSPLAFGGSGRDYLINYITFRLDTPFGHGFSTTLPDIQINFSTTPRAVNDLSANFADNIGANETVMVPRGSLTLSGSYRSDLAVQSLDILLNFSQPFYWSPRDGNLLLDVRNYTRRESSPFDAVDLPNDDVASVFGMVGDTIGTLSSRGLVTGFNVTLVPIPEPSTLALLLVAAAIAAVGWKRMKKRKEPKHVAG